MNDDDTTNPTDYSLNATEDQKNDEEPIIYKSKSFGRRNFLKGLGAASGSATVTTLAGCGGGGGDDISDNTSQTRADCNRETIFTHNLGLSSVAYSPNSQYVATAGGMEVKVWGAMTGDLLLTFTRTLAPYSLAFSPDSERLASYGYGSVVIWGMFSGAEITSFQTSGGSVGPVSFSGDGESIICNSDMGFISIWNANDGSLIRSYTEHTTAVVDMAMSTDRSKVVTVAGSDEMPGVWEFDTLSTLYTGILGTAEPNAVFDLNPTGIDSTIVISDTLKTVDDSFNVNVITNYPSGRYVTVDLTSPMGTRVRLWDPARHLGSTSFAGTFPVNITPTESLAILNGEAIDGAWTLSISSTVGFSSTFIRWSIRSTPYQPSGAVSFGWPGHILFSMANGTIVIWDYENKQLVRQYDQHEQSISFIHVIPDGSKVVSADHGGIMKVWGYDTGNTIVANITNARFVDMSSDGIKAVTGFEYSAYIRDVITGSNSIALLDESTTTTILSVDCSQSGGSTSYCSCDTVCTCDSVCSCDSVCTCDSQCTCQSQCTCDSDSSHYWYPN